MTLSAAAVTYQEQTMNRMLNVMFLRLYGFNLSRSFRNSPRQACGDALTQMIMLMVLPLWMLFGLLGSWLPPGVLAARVDNLLFILSAVLLLPPLILWALVRFSGYRNMLEAANRFRSPRERYKSALMFALVPLLIVLVLVFADSGLH
jgi:hypothetical protein